MDKQTEILKAALKLFVENGFHATPTSKIAKEAGVANGTLFHYYKTKDDLIIALYVDIKTRLSGCIRIDDEKDEDIKARCKRYFTEALQWGLENKTEFKFVQQFLSSPYLLLLAPEEIQKQSQVSLDLVREGIKTKIIKALPADFINTLLASHLFGVNQYILTAQPSAADQKKLINESFEMLWKMITN
jgi:AcrR family transcriptional regulator